MLGLYHARNNSQKWKIMFHSFLVISCLLLSTGIPFTKANVEKGSKNKPTVRLKTDYGSIKQTINLTCEVTTSESTLNSVYLACPMVETKLCFSNCVKLCGRSCPPGLDSIKHCVHQKTEKGVKYTYTVYNALVPKSGKWYCTYRGQTSREIGIDVVPPTKYVTTTTKRPYIPPPPRQPVVPDVKINNPKPPRNDETKNRATPKYNSSKDTKNSKPASWVTRTDLVVGLLIVLMLSIVINVVFCARCMMVKKYVDNIRYGGGNQTCLEKCLCLSPDPYRKMAEGQNGGPHRAGKRRFGPPSSSQQGSSCVYEDIHHFGNGHPTRGAVPKPPVRTPTPTHFEAVYDENGQPVFRITNKVPSAAPSPAHSQRSLTGASYPYKVPGPPPGYYQNGYLHGSMPGRHAAHSSNNNYVIMATNASPFTSLQRPNPGGGGSSYTGSHTIYDDVPMEPRPPTNGGDMVNGCPTFQVYQLSSQQSQSSGAGQFTAQTSVNEAQQPLIEEEDLSNGFPPPPTQAQLAVNQVMTSSPHQTEDHGPVCAVEPLPQFQPNQFIDTSNGENSQ